MQDTENTFPVASDTKELEHGERFAPRFDAHGLIPAIVTDEKSGEVLMFAWMNATALSETLKTGMAHFWSRSRKKQWMKGEESGNVLKISEIATDCDQDVIWLRVTVAGEGKACHTGARSCFYRRIALPTKNPFAAALIRR
ncbi:MAG: phosphoribosyl-AMP cyclohydrolase [Hyphomicrobiaceae bacterium]|nr:phosphoribosyl-AMP cyclohydrolase [Hyphomicrobiaceae bacterium]